MAAVTALEAMTVDEQAIFWTLQKHRLRSSGLNGKRTYRGESRELADALVPPFGIIMSHFRQQLSFITHGETFSPGDSTSFNSTAGYGHDRSYFQDTS